MQASDVRKETHSVWKRFWQ